MTQPLIIGQAPARGNDDKHPFAGESGKRLALLACVGMTGDVLPAYFELRNLISKYPGKVSTGRGDKFDMAAAKMQANLMWDEFKAMPARYVLFMGKSVARAFGYRHIQYLQPRQWNQHKFVCFPHPSGVNRWYNDNNNWREATEFLRMVLRDPNPYTV